MWDHCTNYSLVMQYQWCLPHPWTISPITSKSKDSVQTSLSSIWPAPSHSRLSLKEGGGVVEPKMHASAHLTCNWRPWSPRAWGQDLGPWLMETWGKARPHRRVLLCTHKTCWREVCRGIGGSSAPNWMRHGKDFGIKSKFSVRKLIFHPINYLLISWAFSPKCA